jgi:hypothetical protein
MSCARWIGIFFALFIGVWSSSASAFSLSPSIVEVAVQPGGASTGLIHVENDESVDRTFYISIQTFIPKGRTGQQEFLPLSETTGLPSWIFLSSPSYTLKAGEAQDIPFTIRVPEGAPVGGHYAAVFFSTAPPMIDGASGVAGARTGALVFLTVEGKTLEKMRIKEFLLDSPAVVTHLPILFHAVLQNEGNVHVKAEGTVTVKNMFGRVVSRTSLRTFGARVLPGSEREIPLVWMKEQPQLGKEGFWHELGEEWRNFALGPYTATLDVEGPGTADLAPQEIRFSVWPWRLLVIVLVGLIVVLLLLAWYKRLILHRAVRLHERKK